MQVLYLQRHVPCSLGSPREQLAFVVCRALQHVRKTTQLPAATRMPIIMRWLKGRTSRVANQILGRSRQTTKDDRLSYS